MKIIPYALSDVGKKRDHNEDSYLVRGDVGLFAVADGMGGHQAGERASRMALDTLVGELKPPENNADRKDVLACLRDATQASGAAIFDAAQADPNLQGMGTTLTSLWFHAAAPTSRTSVTRARTSSATAACSSSATTTRGSRSRCAPA